MLHNLGFFFSSKCHLFHNATFFGSCIIHILNTGVLKFKRKFRRQRVNLTKNKELRSQRKCVWKMKWVGKSSESAEGTEVLRKRMNGYCRRKRNPVSRANKISGSSSPWRLGFVLEWGLIQDGRMRWFSVRCYQERDSVSLAECNSGGIQKLPIGS